MPNNEQPLVSVIIPCRNEADFIEATIKSLLDNDYPADKLEVLVVDGMSTDGTREVLQRLCAEDSRVSPLDNSKRIVPTALNKGIINAKGKIVIPVSGHAVVAKDFIKESVRQLQSHPEAWCAGGPIEAVSTTYIGRSVAAAISSPIGAGNAMWRLGNYEGFVDTIAFGAYWRWVFDKIGLFDEELVRNQDDELNLRLIRNGGKIFLSPKIKSRYYARSGLRKLWRQYFQYGFWRIRTMQKHKRPATLRQVMPLLFVASLIVLGFGGILWQGFWWLLVAELCGYALGLLLGTVDVGRKGGWKYAPLAPLVFAILHFGYGLGSLWGIVRFVILRGRMLKKPEEAKLSR